MIKPLTLFTLGLSASLLSACHTAPQTVNTDNVAQLERMHYMRQESTSQASAKIREQALYDVAQSLAARGALAYRSTQINALLNRDERHLDQIFNFDSLLLANNILPPVLVSGKQALNVADNKTLRLTDRVYTIIQQARFVSRPPNWREYLIMGFSKPEQPDKSLLPHNRSESELWRKAIREGWQQGLNQANSIFADRMAALTRDYDGMLLYRKLLAQRMVSLPFVAKTDLGVSGDSEHLRINDQVLRIVAAPSLQDDASKWLPALQDNQS